MPELRSAGERLTTAILLTAFTLAVTMVARPVRAQAPQVSTAAESSSPQTDAATSLPVSLDRIKKELERSESGEGLRGLDQTPHFKVEVVEKPPVNWANYFTPKDFQSPVVPGGIYAYELQQLMFPKTQNPLAQPYAAFTEGELLTVSITTLLQQLLTPEVVKGVQAAQRAHDEQAARDELARALAEYCAAQPNGGAGVFGCKQ